MTQAGNSEAFWHRRWEAFGGMAPFGPLYFRQRLPTGGALQSLEH